MTTAAGTSTGPTARSLGRSARGPVAFVLLLVLCGLIVASLRSTGPEGSLDPDSFTPDGSRALRALLEDREVRVTRVDTLTAVPAATRSTVLVTVPELLPEQDLALLRALSGELVLVGPSSSLLEALDLPVREVGSIEVEARRPACDLPLAVAAGEVDLGGGRYALSGSGSGCYASGGAATLVRVSERLTTVLGSGQALTNARLGARGNAALGLGLLGTSDEVFWVVPRALPPVEGGRGLFSLYDDSVRTAVLGLVAATFVTALWRARRLGRVVVEPLPVVVRAAESVEGRSRLYEAAGARDRAAESLRAATRHRLASRLGLSPTGSTADDAGTVGGLVSTLAARTGSDPSGVHLLLYGPAPVDDAALVRLADDLDALTATLTREVAGP